MKRITMYTRASLETAIRALFLAEDREALEREIAAHLVAWRCFCAKDALAKARDFCARVAANPASIRFGCDYGLDHEDPQIDVVCLIPGVRDDARRLRGGIDQHGAYVVSENKGAQLTFGRQDVARIQGVSL